MVSIFAGEELVVDDFVKVIPTPGHTLTDVTCLVRTDIYGLVAVTGNCIRTELLGQRKLDENSSRVVIKFERFLRR